MNRGGAVQEIVHDMRIDLTGKGHDVRIITPQPRDISNMDTTNTIFLGGGTDFRSPTKTVPTMSASVDTDTIDHVLEQEQFDILHFHEPWVPVLSRQILTRSKSVNIATFHAAIPETLMSRTIIKVVTPYTVPILKYIHEFTAVSEPAATYLRSLTDRPIHMIPNGVDLTKYPWTDHKRSAKGKKTVLYLGRLEARKGVKFLLRAFKMLEDKDPDVHLIIAGKGPDQEKLELLAEDLKLKNVEFKGYVTHEEKMKLLASADLFAAPAIYGESFGLVLLEAMATGNLVVAGNNAGYTDVMDGIGQLTLITPRDSVEFARRMHVMLHEPKVQKVMLDWSKDYVKQFAYPKIIDTYVDLYKKAIKENKV
jgi:phosphatidylinositol alpha-mannosyltransferase